MPEGDTILRTARALARAIGGRAVTAVRSPLPGLAGAGLAGCRIAAVEARGKNLLVRFDDGRTLRTHMRMTGSWHLYRPGEPWLKPERRARLVLETDEYVAVCFNAPVVELIAAGREPRHPSLSRLGPDVLAPGFDLAEAVRRLRERGEREIGEALLLQSAVAGIGNIYKSETLFVCRLDPFRPVAALSDEELGRVLLAARRLMSENLGPGPRATRRALTGPRSRVYGRAGLPCLGCGATIRRRAQGAQRRTTYWCPACQA